ncbi:MAG: hypothetical protein ACXW3D_05325 [Caulobacteraceae bacterium]
MKLVTRTAAAVAILAFASAPATAQQQKVTGPVATYWVSADTTSGMGGMAGAMGGMGAGAQMQQPSMGSMMGGALGGALGGGLGGMFGGRKAKGGAGPGARPANYTHSLTLQLGSTQKAAGEPAAEHLPPQTLGAGPSLPLVTPRQARPEPRTEPYNFGGERPRGKMLIYWGCGEHAAAPPIIIDFAKIGPGMTPPNIPVISVNTPQPPSAGRFATSGEWPNERSRAQIPAEGSLAGAHTIRGNYSPEISFTLAPGQDFLAPLTITGQSPSPAGGTVLTWNPVPGSTGYFAQFMGSGDGEQFVLWTSSANAAFMGQLMDYLPPSEARRLVAARVVMAPATTTCTVPSEVVRQAPMGMLMMIAYGDEVNLGDPPRPANPKLAWDRKWDVKVRFKSTTSSFLGMPGM